MKKKVLAILLSVLMLTSVTLPGTWATTGDAETPTAETTVGDVVIEEPAPETAPATDAAVTEESATESATDTDTESATNSESEDVTVVIVPESDDESAVDESESETAESEEESESAESEETTESAEESKSEAVSKLDIAQFMAELRDCTTVEELDNALDALTEADWAVLAEDEAAMAEIEQLYIDVTPKQPLMPIYNNQTHFTSAGPLIEYDDYGMQSFGFYSERPIALYDAEFMAEMYAADLTEGLQLDKTATLNEDGTYTITLEAFATGESITTIVKDGVDIVLMLDLSNYMYGNEYREIDSIAYLTLYNNYEDDEIYYYKNDKGEYQQIVVSRATAGAGQPGESQTTTYTITDAKTKETVASSTAGNTTVEVTLYQVSMYSNTDDLSKLDALKTAVNGFIVKVHTEAPASRIAIVTYADEAVVESGSKQVAGEALVTVDGDGIDALKQIVNGLNVRGGNSNSHYAMADAVKIFQDVPGDVQEYSRNRVAILFSAGIAGTGWETGSDKLNLTSGQNVAQATMSQAHILKGTKGNTVAVDENANVDGGYTWGALRNRGVLSDTIYTGCGATVYCVGLDIPTSGDPRDVFMGNEPYKSGAQANEYFWRTSSHRLDGKHITNPNQLGENGPSLYKDSVGEYTNYYYFYPDELTQNQRGGYYLTTGSSGTGLERLNDIFEDIANQAVTNTSASTELDTESVITDTIAPQFQLPENADEESITVESYDFVSVNGGVYTFESTTNDITAELSIADDGTISVTGFSFKDNWCGTNKDENNNETPHGAKLVISFTVEKKAGFLGGNDVYTNDGAYVYANATATTPVAQFPRPTVNVPIQDVTVTAEDKNVYLLGNLTADQIKSGATVHCGGVTLDLSKANEDKPYGLEPWQTAYVDIDELKIVDDEGNEVGINDYQNLKGDTTYTVSATVKPKTDGIVASGTPNDTAGKTGKDKGNIYVFKPELTYQDSVVSLGETVANYAANTVSQKWKHGTDYVVEGTAMIGKVPMLEITYSPAIPTGGKKIDSLDDISVTVATATINDEDVLEYITFMREACSYESCLWKTKAESRNNPAFVLHVNTFELTIVKTGWQGIDENQSFIFDVKQGNTVIMTVTIKGNGCVKITGLPAGTYTVEENKNWSWRYTPTYSPASVTLGGTTKSGTITAKNTREGNNWLDGNAYVENKWPLTENQPVTQAVAYGFGKRYN